MTTDAIRDEFLQMSQGALTLDLAFIGVSAGLFAALAEPATPDELADRAEVDAGQVRRWADAAFAFGLLDHDGERFVLTERGRAFVPDAPGTLMPVAVQAVLSAHMADRAVTGLRTGNHFIRPNEVAAGLHSAGLEPEVHLLLPLADVDSGPCRIRGPVCG